VIRLSQNWYQTFRPGYGALLISGRKHVKLPSILGRLMVVRRACNKVVVVGHQRPSLEAPFEVTRTQEEGIQEQIQTLRRAEKGRLAVRTGAM
jgi:hypothetical protein